MKYMVVAWYAKDDEFREAWHIVTYGHDKWGDDVRRYIKEVAIPRYGKENVALMIEENHAIADQMRRVKKVAPAPVAQEGLTNTWHDDGGSF